MSEIGDLADVVFLIQKYFSVSTRFLRHNFLVIKWFQTAKIVSWFYFDFTFTVLPCQKHITERCLDQYSSNCFVNTILKSCLKYLIKKKYGIWFSWRIKKQSDKTLLNSWYLCCHFSELLDQNLKINLLLNTREANHVDIYMKQQHHKCFHYTIKTDTNICLSDLWMCRRTAFYVVLEQ